MRQCGFGFWAGLLILFMGIGGAVSPEKACGETRVLTPRVQGKGQAETEVRWEERQKTVEPGALKDPLFLPARGQQEQPVPMIQLMGFEEIGNPEDYILLIIDVKDNHIYKKPQRQVPLNDLEPKEVFLFSPMGRIQAQRVNGDFSISPRLSFINLRLTDERGNPVPSSRVDAAAFCSGKNESLKLNRVQVKTDNSGKASLAVPETSCPQRDVLLRISCPGFQDREVFWKGARDMDVALAPIHATTVFKLRPEDDFTREVLQKANITFELLDENSHVHDLAKVDEQGLLSFRVQKGMEGRTFVLGLSFGHPADAAWTTQHKVTMEGTRPQPQEIVLGLKELKDQIAPALPRSLIAAPDDEMDYGGGGGAGAGF